ncbi:MAG: PepSY domain-containing protein [Steroidobacteraceae bacterium]
MIGPRTSPSLFVLAMAVLAAVPDARGQAAPAAQPVRPVVRSTRGMSMDQAVKMAEQRFKARVVRAESQQNAGHTIYVLRLLNDSGRVWTVRVDASSGAVL